MQSIQTLLFDWGDTLMADFPEYDGPMADWPRVAAMPGVVETLPLLAARYRCAVATGAGASTADDVRRAFTRLGLDSFISLYVTARELGTSKPDPRFFTGALALLGAQPGHTCMIGNDYDRDITGAKQAGLSTILVTGVRGRYPLADVVIARFATLPQVLTE